nr:cytochrome c3 family protein [Motiliproteus sp. SC1-56]
MWILCLLTALISGPALAATDLDTRRQSKIAETKHNFSSASGNTVRSTDTDEICVFCHTPHGATVQAGVQAPLWNRRFSTASYATYSSTSIQATIDATPGGASKLCLSCHDGTLAIGALANMPGQDVGSGSLSMQGTDAGGTMPGDPASGYSRDLGIDLSNDHPISLTYNRDLALADGELYNPESTTPGQGLQVGIRSLGGGVPQQPRFPLEGSQPSSGKLQCTSCHDPHLSGEGDDAGVNIKFLRGNRFQQAGTSPLQGSFNEDNDIICLACHDKAGWAASAHAMQGVANEQYEDAAANLREFPAGIDVYEASCLNCHDAHTEAGARRLAREGADSAGNSAIEETCYQCHTLAAGIIDESVGTVQVPNIETDFGLARHMPITNAEQDLSPPEQHDIRDADFSEARATLNTRHVECTDCHNPHRVKKTRVFSDTPPVNGAAAGTHRHENGVIHNNIASGVLAGTFGVEPGDYEEFETDQSVLNGIGGLALTPKQGTGLGCDTVGSDPDTCSHVSREYQICLKCHSHYAWENGPTPSLQPAADGGSDGVNGFSSTVGVTNQAMEFQAPQTHRGEGQSLGAEGGAAAAYDTNNHRGWHPVIGPTGRNSSTRGGVNANNWFPPFNASGAMGTQTMYCSDCHGSETQSPTLNGGIGGGGQGSTVPAGGEDGAPWGPHGSSNNFILKGSWNTSGFNTINRGSLCFKCHDPDVYGTGQNDIRTGFYDTSNGRGDLHSYHQGKAVADNNDYLQCNWCHTAVPHGWKNKALLVNLNDVGPETGNPKGTEVCRNDGDDGWGNSNAAGGTCNLSRGYSNGPYYQNAFLKVINFRPSGQWREQDCGSANADDPDKGRGVQWMKAACQAVQ